MHTPPLYKEGNPRFTLSTRRETQRLGGNHDFRLNFRRKRLQKMTMVAGHLLDAGPVSDWTPELQNLLGFRLQTSVDPS